MEEQWEEPLEVLAAVVKWVEPPDSAAAAAPIESGPEAALAEKGS